MSYPEAGLIQIRLPVAAWHACLTACTLLAFSGAATAYLAVTWQHGKGAELCSMPAAPLDARPAEQGVHLHLQAIYCLGDHISGCAVACSIVQQLQDCEAGARAAVAQVEQQLGHGLFATRMLLAHNCQSVGDRRSKDIRQVLQRLWADNVAHGCGV